ncbi:MAG: LysR substrate-binding domain-containing protein [Hyphomicrobiales bacterium]|nr:LysR substrate-binding domain-containing protein [Hyphomicrobiales bacterium]
MLDLNQVQAFLAVVDSAGFSRAARALGSTQPVVSQQVRKLEAAIGARLLARSHARTVPTADGARFLPYARALVRTEERARRSVRKDRLAIAASGNIGTYLLPKVLGGTATAVQTPDPELLVGTNQETAARIQSGVADIALMEWWDDRPGLDATVWRREPLVVIVGPAHGWAARRAVEKAELFDEPLIGGEPGTGTGALLQQVFGRAAARLKVGLTVGSTAAVKEAVKAGLGLSIVMAASVRDEVRYGTLGALEVSDAALVKDLYAVVSSDQPETAPAMRFRSHLLELSADEG